MIRRREFITLLGGAALWPLAARAQQRSDKIRQIGMLMGFAQYDLVAQSMVAAFRGALSNLGWIEGNNVRIELRWAGPDIERINSLAKELAGLRPDVMLGQRRQWSERLPARCRQLRSCLSPCPIPSAAVSPQVSRIRAAISPASRLMIPRWAANGWNC
jgi:hypothetical protein